MKSVKDLQGKLARGEMTRRGFLEATTAMGISAALVPSLIKEAKAAPQKGGTLRQAITGGGTGDVLDPAQTLDSYMINVSFGQLRNCLTEIGPDGELIGEVAESWEASPDAKTWTFKIRQGIEFHNGKTLDANDVLESINHHRGEETKSAAKGIIAPVIDAKTDGKDTVVFELSGGNADFPFLMSDYHLCMCPAKAEGGIDWESGVGSGGYVLKSFEPGQRTVVERNPNYWKADRAHFDGIENLYIAEVNSRTNALQTGEIDLMTNVDLKTVHLFKRRPGINVFHTTGNKHCTLPMNTTLAPFDNNDLRMALKLSVDREQWRDTILKGYGEVGNDFPIGPANRYRATADEIPQRTYDPEKAKHHLKKAGMEGAKIPLHVADTAFEGALDAALLLKESAKAAGLDIDVVREPNDGYWSNVWLKKPWVASYWGGRPTEDWIFSQIYSAGADWNESFWNHEKFNKILVEARAELDVDKRRAMYVEMQQICADEGGVIIPLFMAYTHAASDKVGLPDVMANNWELDGHKNAERWWFNS